MLSLIRHLLNCPIGGLASLQVEYDLVGFISFYVLHETLLNTKNNKEDESEKDLEKDRRKCSLFQNMELERYRGEIFGYC